MTENAASAFVNLPTEDADHIRTLVNNADVGGERYPLDLLKSLAGDSMPLEEWKGRKEDVRQ